MPPARVAALVAALRARLILPADPSRSSWRRGRSTSARGWTAWRRWRRRSCGSDPSPGVVLVFRAKRADRIKILVWDGSGLMLIAKRLEEGKFAWPPMSDGVMRLSRRSSPRCSKGSTGGVSMPGASARPAAAG